jgi:hypothetical protein
MIKLTKILLEDSYSNTDSDKVVKEYISRDMVYLKDYFSMPLEDKMAELPQEYYYLFEDFIDDEGFYFERPEDLEDDFELVEWLDNNDKNTFNAFAKYLYSRIQSNTLPVPDSEYPAWSYFDDSPEIIKNQWLIHFTNDAQGIEKSGFKYGVDDMTKLGLTTHLGEFDKKYGGYNFAYLLSDFPKYAKNRRGYKYGDEAVIFNASGIRLWHYGDQEPQVIFYGNTAKNIVSIIGGESAEFAIYSKDGRVLYEDDDLTKVVNWFVTNYRQYRKAIS